MATYKTCCSYYNTQCVLILEYSSKDFCDCQRGLLNINRIVPCCR